MSNKPFYRLYLQPTQSRLFFSFVTYTPQTREQMIGSGDLLDGEEYINQVVCDFLLFIAEGILGLRFTSEFPIQYDDVRIVCSRQRGQGVQHEYLLRIQADRLTKSGLDLLDLLNNVLTSPQWEGFVNRRDWKNLLILRRWSDKKSTWVSWILQAKTLQQRASAFSLNLRMFSSEWVVCCLLLRRTLSELVG